MYLNWGFSGSPFDATSLPATEFGQRLLVGRTDILEKLKKRIASPPKIPVIEGLNGVGKTSLVNVASYELLAAHGRDEKSALFIPCRQMFQLTPNPDIDRFVSSVFYAVAQTLIERSEEVRHAGIFLQSASINRWLNDPQLSTWQGGIPILSMGKQSETNTGSGFEQSGFERAVTGWLERIFPDQRSGGVVCTIDNLELLQSSETARALVERLRDVLFNVKGLRWILCGSLGITYGVVSSPRMEGFLHSPIEVGEVNIGSASEILRSRIKAYATSEHSNYLPISEIGFEYLYKVLRGNLRSVLSYADRYCQYVDEEDILPSTDEDKDATLLDWTKKHGADLHRAITLEVRSRAMEVFMQACDEGGVFSPGEFEKFGFNSVQAIRPHIRDLENVSVLISTQDETDKRRKTIQVTAKGWMIRNHLEKVE